TLTESDRGDRPLRRWRRVCRWRCNGDLSVSAALAHDGERSPIVGIGIPGARHIIEVSQHRTVRQTGPGLPDSGASLYAMATILQVVDGADAQPAALGSVHDAFAAGE